VRQVPHVIKLARALTMRIIGEGLWMTGTVGHGKTQIEAAGVKQEGDVTSCAGASPPIR
jgi:hypothetical protein